MREANRCSLPFSSVLQDRGTIIRNANILIRIVIACWQEEKCCRKNTRFLYYDLSTFCSKCTRKMALLHFYKECFFSICITFFFFFFMRIFVNLLQKSDMVEEAIRFGTRVNGDSGFRVSLVCRFGGGTRNFGGQHDVQRNVQKR